jgi:uncharacterized protein (TIGR02145 family)
MIIKQNKEYEIVSLLGQGAMAHVYLAHDSKFDTNVAIKLLNKESIYSENIRKRFLAEAKSMFRMSHPNIIKVTDLIDDGDTVAFVMEYVEGETLKEFIERKIKLSDKEITSIFTQMLDAVGYVHEQNLVHRDIKPSNFMIDSKGKVKLMDFGIAKTTDSSSAEYTQTGTGVQMGTPMYMSPEQVKSTKEVTFTSDIYSLGVVLWQLVKGEKPYDTNTLSTFELQLKIVQEDLPITNSNYDNVISKATAKKISERFLSCNSIFECMNRLNNKYNQIEDLEKTISNAFTEAESQGKKEITNNQEIAISSTSLGARFFSPLVRGIAHNAGIYNSELEEIHGTGLDGRVTKKDILTYIENKGINNKNITESLSSNQKDTIVIEGHVEILSKNYETVKIGNQTWMTKNLDVDRFRNGDIIPEAKTKDEWIHAGKACKPVWCYYENDKINGEKFGKLYNWYAVNDFRGLAPQGFHVTSNIEWTKIVEFLGGKYDAGNKLKSKSGWFGWFHVGGTNESGFNALPGGYRDENNGCFEQLGFGSYWWTSTEHDINEAFNLDLTSHNDSLNCYENSKKAGLSVRCIKDISI